MFYLKRENKGKSAYILHFQTLLLRDLLCGYCSYCNNIKTPPPPLTFSQQRSNNEEQHPPLTQIMAREAFKKLAKKAHKRSFRLSSFKLMSSTHYGLSSFIAHLDLVQNVYVYILHLDHLGSSLHFILA